MTPALIKGRQDALFAITASGSPKVKDLIANSDVEWMLQSKALDQVVKLKGKIKILDNPVIKAEILEQIGSKLTTFWKINKKDSVADIGCRCRFQRQ